MKKAFSSFKRRVSRAMRSSPSTQRANSETMSHDSQDEIQVSLTNYNETVVEILLKCPEMDLSRDTELYTFLVDHFNVHAQVAGLRKSVDEALEKVHQFQGRVEQALRHFTEEERIFGEDASFRRTREDLKSVVEYSHTELIDPVFMEQLQSCPGKLAAMSRKLDAVLKKIENHIRWKRLGNSVLRKSEHIVWLVEIPSAIFLGPIGAPVAAGLHVGIGSAVTTLSPLLDHSIDVLKRIKEEVESLKNAITIEQTQLEDMIGLVNAWTNLYKSIAETAEMAVERKSRMRAAMKDIDDWNLSLTDVEFDLCIEIEDRDTKLRSVFADSPDKIVESLRNDKKCMSKLFRRAKPKLSR
ncbi:PREDICTED: uncharacterized protein LOC104802200 [Tarenaya hassleriana]|uniref:uncharacterized protein LOC104802200 n=1 Tax=Tarenaya hassleriana TaxID=28532 RepID=UPI00053C195E|nr:PREDICTED: uncharacterized protein LOC104802200 [Tarenaya hassleriana]